MACSETGQHVFALTTTCSGATDKLGNACSLYGVWRSVDSGASWSRSGAQALNWRAVTASADGRRVLAAAAGNGVRGACMGCHVRNCECPQPRLQHNANPQIYRSFDFGRTWTKTPAPVASYIGLAASSDATRVVAIAYGDGSIYLTSDEFGATTPTWTRKPVYTSNSPPWQPWISSSTQSWHNWRVVVRSAAGDRLAAVSNYGFIYSSSNNGSSVNPNAKATPAKDGVAHSAGWEWWVALAGSADGKVLYAAEVLNGALYTSTNYGSGQWTQLVLPSVTC